MLNREESESLFIELARKFIERAEDYKNITIEQILERYTEKSAPEIPESIKGNIKKYFKLNERVEKLELLYGNPFGNHLLESKINEIIKTFNQIIGMLEIKDVN